MFQHYLTCSNTPPKTWFFHIPTGLYKVARPLYWSMLLIKEDFLFEMQLIELLCCDSKQNCWPKTLRCSNTPAFPLCAVHTYTPTHKCTHSPHHIHALHQFPHTQITPALPLYTPRYYYLHTPRHHYTNTPRSHYTNVLHAITSGRDHNWSASKIKWKITIFQAS